jgi:hypothetical protein
MLSLAEEIFAENPNVTSEDQVLDLGFALLRKQEGLKSARYYFCYHEDFPSDYVSEYFWLQRQARIGVDQ